MNVVVVEWYCKWKNKKMYKSEPERVARVFWWYKRPYKHIQSNWVNRVNSVQVNKKLSKERKKWELNDSQGRTGSRGGGVVFDCEYEWIDME